MVIGLNSQAGAKSISDQIKQDGLNVEIDYSAAINKQLITENICQTAYSPTKFNNAGIPIKMLGFAHVYMGAGPGVSKMGHLGERFIYCIGNELEDIYYDGIKAQKENLETILFHHPNATREYILSNKVIGALYIRKIQNPTQMGIYGLDTINRNIYEQWLDISENEILNLLIANIKKIEKQRLQISHEKKLPSFNSFINNCTKHVTLDLKSIPTLQKIQIEDGTDDDTGFKKFNSLGNTLNTVRPKSVYKALSEANITKLLVIYPSVENMRKIYFTNLTTEDAIDLLEVPYYSINPKFSNNWNSEEIIQLENNLRNYKSPLATYLYKKIQE